MNEYNTKLATRYSLLDLSLDDNKLNIPLYCIWNTEYYFNKSI